MKLRILTLSLLLVLLASFALVGCAEHIADTNGDDTSICTITKEQIEAEEAEWLGEELLADAVDGVYTMRAPVLSGVYDMSNHLAECETLTIATELTLTKGNLRAILMCDGKPVQDIPLGSNTLVIKGAKGKYYLRLAAESAEVDVKVTFTES